jgi:hypothetical protein
VVHFFREKVFKTYWKFKWEKPFPPRNRKIIYLKDFAIA